MPVGEYVYRSFRLLRSIVDYPLVRFVPLKSPKISIPDNVHGSIFSESFKMDIQRNLPGVYRDECIAEADKYVRHCFSYFELNNHFFGSVIQWNYDYKNNIHPPVGYAPFINLKDSAKVGDVKYVFEHNKHQDLPRIAQAYYLTKNERYLHEIVDHVESWIEQCPFMHGVHWVSPTVSAYRLVSWTMTFEILRNECPFPPDFLEKWCQSVYQHIQFISKNYSGYSSAGNHLISEAVGVFVASLRWQEFYGDSERECLAALEKQAYNILLTEIQSQIFPDGVCHEQSASYQAFVSNQFFLAYWVGSMAGITFPEIYMERLCKSGEFIESILDASGKPPNFGDEDDAWAFRLSSEMVNKFNELLGVWSVLFENPHWIRNGELPEAAFWLFGNRALKTSQPVMEKATHAVTRNGSDEKYYSQGGYYILKQDGGSGDEVFLFLDCGPLGVKSTGGHGHADALSLCLSLGGIPVFVDSGTYVYKDTVERMRLRSTSAHNTIYFNNLDSQDKYLGPFLWGARHKATGYLKQTGCFLANVIWWSGETHTRETMFENNKLTINDCWQGRTTPTIAFHLNPDLQGNLKQLDNNCVFIEAKSFIFRIQSIDQQIYIEKTAVSPSFYQMKNTLKLIVNPKISAGSHSTILSWEFK